MPVLMLRAASCRGAFECACAVGWDDMIGSVISMGAKAVAAVVRLFYRNPTPMATFPMDGLGYFFVVRLALIKPRRSAEPECVAKRRPTVSIR